MSTVDSKSARARLDRIISDAAESHEPVLIAGKDARAVLVSEEDWRAIQETLYLLSVPGMRESIRRGFKTPVSKCLKTIRW